jgi:putative transposase
MYKTIKIRLYPSKEQEIYISKLLGCNRLVYNLSLSKKIEAYKTDKTNLGLKELSDYFYHDLRISEKYNFIKEHNTKIFNQGLMNLLDAYKIFFINNQCFPKFKSKKDTKQSCRFPYTAISKLNNYLSDKLTLTKQLKNLKFKCSDKDKKYLTKYKTNIVNATLTKTSSNNYFLSILVDGNIEKKLIKPVNKIVGIDLGIKDFIVVSNNIRYENIKSIRSNENKLKRLNKSLSRKQRIKTDELVFSKKYNKEVEVTKLSKNGEKARIKLAKFHERIANKKEYYLHSIVNQLLNENQVIVIEDLNVSGLMKNHRLARSIQELSLSRFKEILLYKANWYDRTIIQIDRFYPSSKLCSICGYKYQNLKLSEREWTCPVCNTKHDRDYNASKNIEKEGDRIIGKCST